MEAKNYYLIQLTGPNADEPYLLRGFVVKDGTPQPFGTRIPTNHFAATLKTKSFFEISIVMKDAAIRVHIGDSETGEELPVGMLTDPNGNFPIGAVGIAAHDNEQNEIGRFIVVPIAKASGDN